MDLNSKDTNELENILADELVGYSPQIKLRSESKKSIKRWVDWVFKTDEIKKKFREDHQNVFFESQKQVSWLDYYKGVLIKEIRDIKLKKLI